VGKVIKLVIFFLQYKVSSLLVKAGPHPDEYTKIGHLEIDSRHCGWSWFPIESMKCVKSLYSIILVQIILTG